MAACANLKEMCDRLLRAVDAKEWVRCPNCRKEFGNLRPSGLCIECDPYRSTVTKQREKVDSVLRDIGADAKTRAAGDE